MNIRKEPRSGGRGQAGAWVVLTVGITLAFGRLAAYNLGNYRPVTNDEVELMSVAYKLATHGVLGSDLFAGFFGADQHFFIVLPLQHFLEAATFRVFGAGVAQARWVSLVAGVAVVWLVGWLALRWYGLATAVLCELFLVAWPSGLAAAANDLPLFGVTRVARYDVLAVAFAWLALALLDLTLRRPRASVSFAVGLACGLAALSTFLGAFVLPVVLLVWLSSRGPRAFGERTLYLILAGTAVVVLPWAVFALSNPADLAGQLEVFGSRGDFLRPSFYLENVLAEPRRYSGLLPTGLLSPWLFAVAIGPAIAATVWRSRRMRAQGDRILLASLVTFEGLLLFLDQTKSPLYAIMLLPSLCLALAAMVTGACSWAWRHGAWPRLASGALGLGLLGVIASDALSAYQLTFTQSAAAERYLDVGEQLQDSLRPGARVLGPERWWWALHDHPYLSLRSQWFQWTAAAARGQNPQFVDWVTRARADSIIVNDNVRGDLLDFPDTVQRQFWAFIDTCTQRVAELNDPTYLEIEIYEIITPPPPTKVCASNG